MFSEKKVQVLPAQPDLPRVETGAVQFGSDWPGLFIRGDDAHSLMMCIRRLTKLLGDHSDADVADALRLLASYADTIHQDVTL